MDLKRGHLSFFLFLCSVLLTLERVAGEPQDCYLLRQVFTQCSCYGAMNDQNQETTNPVVDCSGRGLTQVPSPAMDFSKPIYELRLNNNSITNLGSNILLYLKIRALYLSDNSISSVDAQAFNSLGPNLLILHLDGDGVSAPPKEAFLPLRELEELTMRNFRAQFVDSSTTYFLSFTKLKHLTLDNWGITSMDHEAFNGPNALLSLTLLNQPFSTLPIDALHSTHLVNLQMLKISNTPIETVTYGAFSSLNQIREIDLSHNHINMLEEDCFMDVGDTLATLILSTNLLRSSSANEWQGLKGLSNLEELDLSHNENIQSIPDLSQLGTTKPLKLYLNQNTLTTIPANAFAGVASNLHTLDLSQNEIHTMDENVFNGVTQLEVLYITDQSGTSLNPLKLPPSLIQAANSLKQLHLNGQAVDGSPLWAVVSQLKMLEAINLGSAELTDIPDKALENVIRLRELDLSHNRLSVITQESLVGPRDSLKDLYLSANQISSLPSCLFYQYTSFPITLTLDLNPLTCDCNLWWLWARIKNNTIMFTTGQEAKCSDGELLASKQETDFCPGGHAEPQCDEYYTTTTVATTLVPPPKLTVTVPPTDIQATAIIITWSLSDPTDLQHFTVVVSNVYNQSQYRNDNIPPNSRMIRASSLRPNTHHTFCVTAVFRNIKSVVECGNTRTADSGVTNSPGGQTGSKSEDVGIIVAAVIGAVVLLALIAAIAYLVFFRNRRRKQSSNNAPIQPRQFAKAELPGMSPESRTFAKPKRPPGAGDQDHKDGMQVVAISDGQTSGDGRSFSNGRVGRAAMLNSDGSYKVMNPSSKSSSGSSQPYENDHGSLPPTPSKHLPPHDASYYNQGFRDDKYDEVDPTKENEGIREIVL